MRVLSRNPMRTLVKEILLFIFQRWDFFFGGGYFFCYKIIHAKDVRKVKSQVPVLPDLTPSRSPRLKCDVCIFRLSYVYVSHNMQLSSWDFFFFLLVVVVFCFFQKK